jgi:hypothetical protein
VFSVNIALDNSLRGGLLIYCIVNLIASELFFYHWTNNVRLYPRNHPLSALKMASIKKRSTRRFKKSPRAAVSTK